MLTVEGGVVGVVGVELPLPLEESGGALDSAVDEEVEEAYGRGNRESVVGIRQRDLGSMSTQAYE